MEGTAVLLRMPIDKPVCDSLLSSTKHSARQQQQLVKISLVTKGRVKNRQSFLFCHDVAIVICSFDSFIHDQVERMARTYLRHPAIVQIGDEDTGTIHDIYIYDDLFDITCYYCIAHMHDIWLEHTRISQFGLMCVTSTFSKPHSCTCSW